MREHLPQRRRNENITISYQSIPVQLSFGYYDDGRVGEVFISTTKVGSTIDIMARDAAVLISILLQYGCSTKMILRTLTANEMGKPEGIAGAIVSEIIKAQS